MNQYRLLLIPSLLVAAAIAPLQAQQPPTAPSAPLRWQAWQIPAEALVTNGPLAIVTDEQAESKREQAAKEGGAKSEEKAALIRRVSRQSIAKSDMVIATTPPVPWKSLPAGVYRISARVKMDGEVNIIGTPIRLFVHPVFIGADGKQAYPGGVTSLHPDLAQSFSGYQFKEPNQYQVLTWLYEVDPTAAKRLKVKLPIDPARMFQSMWAKEPQVNPPPVPKPADGIVIGVMLPQTKYSPKSGMPPNSVRSVSVDWLAMERIDPSPSLTARHVYPAKRWVRPGDKQSFDVAIENFTGVPQKKPCRVYLVRGVDERTVLRDEEISLAPGETKTITVPWQTTKDTPIWGYEVRAEIRSGDKADSTAYDFFSVHPEAYTVLIMGTQFRRDDPFREHGNYANLMEMFGATPGDCAQVCPPNEQWMGGMMEVPYSFESVRKSVEHNASIGVQTVMYLFAGGTAMPVMDLYVRKPEWFCGRMLGTDLLYRKQQEIMETIRTFDFKKNVYTNPMVPHVEMGLNFWDPALMAQVTQQTLDFVQKTGYGGIRFDVGMFGPQGDTTCYGEKLPYDMKDAMKVGASNFTQYCTALRKASPSFEFGANMDTWAYLESVGKRNQAAPAPETYPEFMALAGAHGMFMDEGTMSAPFYSHYMNRFEDGLWSMCQKREVTRRCGGIYQLFSPHRDGNGYFAHDDIYWTIMIITSGSYYVGNFAPVPYSDDSAGQFIIRFGEFLRSKGLRSLAGAADLIYVDSPGTVWYADTAVWEDIGGKRRYVIPLINPPINERMRRNKTGELPPPILEPFPIEVKVPEGFSRAKACMLTWEPRVQAVPLEVTVEKGNARVKFPGLQLCRTLVVEFEK